MNKTLSIISVVISAFLFAFAGCNSREASGPTADSGAAPANSLDRVTAGVPIKKTLQLFTEQPERVVAFEETPILSKLAGYVESVHFDIGDKVSKGQVLVRLHAPEYKDRLEQNSETVVLLRAGLLQAGQSVEIMGKK